MKDTQGETKEKQEQNQKQKLISADVAKTYLQSVGFQDDIGLKLRYWRQEWWLWDNKKYLAKGKEEIRAGVMEYLQANHRKYATVSFAANVMANLESLCIVAGDVEQPAWLSGTEREATDYAVMENGVLDIKGLLDGAQESLIPHSPSFFSRIVMPYHFNPWADCPRWLSFLEQMQPDEGCRNLLQEWCGYCLTPDTSYQKFLILEGDGANGKSVFLYVLAELLGRENVSSVPLELFGATHNLVETLGKLANIAPEAGELSKTDEGILKSFTGGDPIQFNPKYKAVFTARPTARLVIAINSRPRFIDRSLGLWRRILLVMFPVTISQPEQNPNLARELCEELPGIFNWAVAGLYILRQRGRFEEPEASKAAKAEYQLEANPARSFLCEWCEEDSTVETPTGRLYESYQVYCKRNGNQPMNGSNFGKEVRRAFPDAVKKQRGTGGGRYMVYVGVKLEDNRDNVDFNSYLNRVCN